MNPIPYTDEDLVMLGLSPDTTNTPPQGGGFVEGGQVVPFSGQDMIDSVESDMELLSFDEFEEYRKAKAKQDLSFWDYADMAAEAGGMAAEEVGGGIWSAVSQGLYLTDPIKGLKTGASMFARGTNDLMYFIGDIFTKDYHAADTYEDFLADTGKPDTEDSRKEYNRQLGDDLRRFNLHRAYQQEREKWRTGKTKTILPFIGEIEGEDVKAAEAGGYFADPSVLVPGFGLGTKVAQKAAAAATRTGGKAVGAGGRLVTKITDKIGTKFDEIVPTVGPTNARIAGAVGGIASGNPWVTAAMVAPDVGRHLDVTGRLGEKVAESLTKRPSQYGVLERIARDSTVDPKLRKLSRLLHLGGVGDKVLSGTGSLALGVGTGMAVGGILGGLAQGWEGFARGVGAGGTIGGPAALAGRGISKLTGIQRRAAENADIQRFLEQQADKGIDPKELARKLDRDTLLRAATADMIFQGELKKGKIPIDKKIDFHGKTINEAKEIFNQAIVNSYNQNKRCILFITGKGLRYNKNVNNQDYKNQPKLFYGKIRESFLDWVKDPKLSKYILTFEKAGIEKGGDGAFYIYLRKKKT